MASAQCYKQCEEQSCNQSNSLGQKMSTEVTSWAHLTHSTTGQTQTQCYAKTQTDCTDQGMAKTQTTHCHSRTLIHESNQETSHGHGCDQTQKISTDQDKAQDHCQTQTHASNGMATCNERNKNRAERKKKRGLFHRIKDRIAGDSSSESESESDDDNSGKRKASVKLF